MIFRRWVPFVLTLVLGLAVMSTPWSTPWGGPGGLQVAETAEAVEHIALTRPAAVMVDALPLTSARLDDLVARGGFNGAVLAARGDEVVLRKVFGTANYERDEPLTLDSRFRIASVSKQFTAAAILRLQDRGVLSVDDPLCRWVQPCPAAWGGITLHHLLSHTSGVSDNLSRPGWQERRRIPQTPQELQADSAALPLDFPPGTRMRYSNAGYNLLGDVVEAASGRPFHEFLRAEFFEPLEMDDTGHDDGTVQTAMGYAWLEGVRTPQDEPNSSIVHAAGALYSTPGDLLKWSRALHGGRLLSADSYRRMTTAHNPPLPSPPRGRAPRGLGYGLFMADMGARMEPAFRSFQIHHTGSWAGTRALVSYQPETDVTVIALSNHYPQRDALFLITQWVMAETGGRPLPDRIAPN